MSCVFIWIWTVKYITDKYAGYSTDQNAVSLLDNSQAIYTMYHTQTAGHLYGYSKIELWPFASAFTPKWSLGEIVIHMFLVFNTQLPQGRRCHLQIALHANKSSPCLVGMHHLVTFCVLHLVHTCTYPLEGIECCYLLSRTVCESCWNMSTISIADPVRIY